MNFTRLPPPYQRNNSQANRLWRQCRGWFLRSIGFWQLRSTFVLLFQMVFEVFTHLFSSFCSTMKNVIHSLFISLLKAIQELLKHPIIYKNRKFNVKWGCCCYMSANVVIFKCIWFEHLTNRYWLWHLVNWYWQRQNQKTFRKIFYLKN